MTAERVFDRDLGWQFSVSERGHGNGGSNGGDGTMLHRVSILDRNRFQKELVFNSMDVVTIAKVESCTGCTGYCIPHLFIA